MQHLLREANIFSTLDIHFAKLMGELGDNSFETALAAALVSKHCREGDVCLDIPSTARTSIANSEGTELFTCPDRETWLKAISQSYLVGAPGDFAPLILDYPGERLYLQRFYQYERDVGDILCSLGNAQETNISTTCLLRELEKLFPETEGGSPNWQRAAAATAVLRKLVVISGGPGTGKTTTIAKTLALLLKLYPDLSIRLAAPTGKAAARLQQALNLARENIPEYCEYLDQIPTSAQTIHRLLGASENRERFHYSARHKLPADLVVVDEASMVDISLMAALLRALPEDSRLILSGDKDQLASVEAGSVLGDICGDQELDQFTPAQKDILGKVLEISVQGSKNLAAFADSLVQLKQTYRFREDSGINRAAGAVKAGRTQDLLQTLEDQTQKEIEWLELRDVHRLERILETRFLPWARRVPEAKDARQALQEYGRFRLLSPVRKGPFGAHGLNRLTEDLLYNLGCISRSGPWYQGRPVIVTRNDYQLGLANGDTGVVWPGEHGMQAVFSSDTQELLEIPLLRLPTLETAFSLTVHKAQGAEFENLLLILPPWDNPVLTRELIYTAITRSKSFLCIAGTPEILQGAASRPCLRTSGLKERLWGSGPA